MRLCDQVLSELHTRFHVKPADWQGHCGNQLLFLVQYSQRPFYGWKKIGFCDELKILFKLKYYVNGDLSLEKKIAGKGKKC